ncbi:MarR family winged helix-turn-helix transcriptional regulator [Smaragdicoccus niigatensis]|uniref:MarR family winged helix-turn-helix transcriptional regulator n=1 Tax=Smaragdicoccus niigatensis TaxID=359359 RepID=UPI00035F375D|nr:MarR family winged helix-turn-helix transcriptional regulator [Smaragdicoccus niigatensis]
MADPNSTNIAIADELGTILGNLRHHIRHRAGSPFPAGSLTGAQIDVVRSVRMSPGLSVADVAADLGVAPNTVSTLVRQLTELGVLVRHTDEQDRRIARLDLTPTARQQLENWRDHRTALLSESIADLTSAEVASLAEALPVLSKLTALLGESVGVRI